MHLKFPRPTVLKAYTTHISVFPWRKLHCTGFAVHYFRQQSMLAISVLWRRKKNSTRYESATLFCYTTMETEVNRESRRPPTTKTDREYWQMDMCSRNFRGGCGWVGGSSIGRTKIASELYKALEEYTAYVTACKTGSNYILDSDRLIKELFQLVIIVSQAFCGFCSKCHEPVYIKLRILRRHPLMTHTNCFTALSTMLWHCFQGVWSTQAFQMCTVSWSWCVILMCMQWRMDDERAFLCSCNI